MINLVSRDDRIRIDYFCCLVEYIARKTGNTRNAIMDLMPDDFLLHGLNVAMTNACLSFEQVSDEYISALSVPLLRDCSHELGRERLPEPATEFQKVFTHIALGKIIQDCAVALIENGGMEPAKAVRYAMARQWEKLL